MNNVVLIGTLVDLLEHNEHLLRANMRVFNTLIPIVCYNTLAEHAYEALLEGSNIAINGSLQRPYKDLEVIVTKIIRIGGDE
jgi:single-stranded DNA-binding protein